MSEAAVNWVDVFSALLTPTIGLIAVLIAYQQYRINHLRLKHELYEARLRVYQAVQGFLSEIFRNGKADDVRCVQFYREASEAVFLFDDSVQTYIDTLYESAIDLAALQEKLYPADGSNGVAGEERGQVAKEKTELLKWFYRQLKESKKTFSAKMRVA